MYGWTNLERVHAGSFAHDRRGEARKMGNRTGSSSVRQQETARFHARFLKLLTAPTISYTWYTTPELLASSYLLCRALELQSSSASKVKLLIQAVILRAELCMRAGQISTAVLGQHSVGGLTM